MSDIKRFKLSPDSKRQTPSLLSTESSSNECHDYKYESTKSERSDITFRIKDCTSKWRLWGTKGRAHEAQYVDDHNVNALESLPIRIYDETKPFDTQLILKRKDNAEEKEEEARINIWMRLFSSKISTSQEMLLRDISRAVLIDVSEQRYTHVFSHEPRRESLLHGAYPDSLYSSAVKEETEKQIRNSLVNLCDLNSTANKIYPDLPAWFICHLIAAARNFVYTVSAYLNQQPEIREYAVTDLFAAFAAVSGLNFRNAQCVDKRSMKVLGVDVSSEADLRAYAQYVTQSGSLEKSPPRSLEVISIAEVKVVPPDGDVAWLDSISPLSGQLLGEMILEIPHSAIDHKDGDLTMSSFAVQGTKVRMCILVLPKRALEYMQDPNHNAHEFKHGQEVDFSKGKLDWSISLDIMKPKDRLKLWTSMIKLANCDNITCL